MQVLAPTSPSVELSLAEQLSRNNWLANHRALANCQPAMAATLDSVELEVGWTFARDGALTGMQPNGRWWADCSVPLLAGRELLTSLDPEGHGSCLLAPPHAGLVRAARERIGPWAVLFVLQPDLLVARMLLACDDFSEQIEKHRLWFVGGEEWSSEFAGIFAQYPGLATPSRFIRTKLTPDVVSTSMITDAQDVFSKVLTERGTQLAASKLTPITVVDRRKVLLVGGSEFRLWNNGAAVLQEQLSPHAEIGEITIHRFNTDDALCTAPAALVDAARNCGSVLSADLYRADSNELVPPELPWITWMTKPAAPPFITAGPRDGLVLADEAWMKIVRDAGWPTSSIRVAGWPTAYIESPAVQQRAALGFICDTQPIDIPKTVKDFSSHRLLWDLVQEEMHADPLVVEDIEGYLTDRARQLNIGMDVLDRASFVGKLILPAYQQGLARLMIAADVPIKLWGEGWAELPEFGMHFGSVISDEPGFLDAMNASSALVYCWPTQNAHPMQGTGKLIVYPQGRDASQLIRNARRALATAGRTSTSKRWPDHNLVDAMMELLLKDK